MTSSASVPFRNRLNTASISRKPMSAPSTGLMAIALSVWIHFVPNVIPAVPAFASAAPA